MSTRFCRLESKSMFRVEVPGIGDAEFTKCSPIKQGVETEEYYEGGKLLPIKYAGKGKVDNVTLERGSTTDIDLLEWFETVANFSENTGADPCDPNYKRDVAVIQLNRNGDEIKRYVLTGAFPVMIEHGDWDASSTEKVIEKVELAYDYPDIN